MRPLRASDAQVISENANDPEIAKYTLLPFPYQLKDAMRFIRRSRRLLRRCGSYDLGIVPKGGRHPVGVIGLDEIDHNNMNAELGYWLGKKYWRQGFTSEAVGLMLNLGFDGLGLVRIRAHVMQPNVGSSKLLENAGFRLEGIARRARFRNGEWYDVHLYGMLKDDFVLPVENVTVQTSSQSKFPG